MEPIETNIENDIPLQCKICKHHLEDEDLIEEYGKKDICDYNNDLCSEGCDVWKIGKWALLEYLLDLEKTIKQIKEVIKKNE